ncbi:MAG TPA: hypothetical protein VMW01_07340 [Williamwhitmania sp.]|nr:hypothetical protein [Williamwhitmania sp.]
MKKLTYLITMMLMVALMSASCSKKDDAVNPTPPPTPTNPMVAHIVGKWINTATYYDGQLSNVVGQRQFEFILNGNAIETDRINSAMHYVYTSWTLSSDNTTLTLSNGQYDSQVFTIASLPLEPDYNTMALDLSGGGHTFRYVLSKQ